MDKDANEKEYSLDELYESAIYVREHYASSVRSGADSLRLRGASMKPPPPQQQQQGVSSPPPQQGMSSVAAPPAPIGKPETHDDKAILSDKAEEQLPPPNQQPKSEEAPQKTSPAMMPEDSSPDILGSAIALFFSTIFSLLWFVIFGSPLRVLRSTLVLAFSAVLLSFLWLQLADYNRANEMGATTRMFTDHPGIM